MPDIFPDDPVQPQTLFEVIYRYTCNNQICMSVLHYAYSVGGTVTSYINATNHLLGIVADVPNNTLLKNIAATQSQSVSYLDASAQVVFPARFIKFTSNINLIGSIAAGAQAQNVAAVITKQTKLASRAGYGSLHIGGQAIDSFISGLFIAEHKAKLNFVATSLLLPIVMQADAMTLMPAIMNKEEIPDSDPPKFRIKGYTELYTTTVRPEVRTMRRRTVGLGI